MLYRFPSTRIETITDFESLTIVRGGRDNLPSFDVFNVPIGTLLPEMDLIEICADSRLGSEMSRSFVGTDRII